MKALINKDNLKKVTKNIIDIDSLDNNELYILVPVNETELIPKVHFYNCYYTFGEYIFVKNKSKAYIATGKSIKEYSKSEKGKKRKLAKLYKLKERLFLAVQAKEYFANVTNSELADSFLGYIELS